jgi:hypothetical protein
MFVQAFPTKLILLMRSVRFRLALWFATVLAAVLLAFCGFVFASQARDLRNDTLDRLNYKTRKLETYFKYNGDRFIHSNSFSLFGGSEEGGSFLQENDILALIDLDGQVMQKVGPIQEASVEELAETGLKKGLYQSPFSHAVVEASTKGSLIRENYLFVVAPISVNRAVVGVGAGGRVLAGGPGDAARQDDHPRRSRDWRDRPNPPPEPARPG